MTDLSALIARLEAAEVGGRELDAAIWCALNGYVFVQWDGAGCAYRERPDWGIGHQQSATIAPVTTSLDAAAALASRLELHADRLLFEVLEAGEFKSDRLILALCIALLRAKQGEGE